MPPKWVGPDRSGRVTDQAGSAPSRVVGAEVPTRRRDRTVASKPASPSSTTAAFGREGNDSASADKTPLTSADDARLVDKAHDTTASVNAISVPTRAKRPAAARPMRDDTASTDAVSRHTLAVAVHSRIPSPSSDSL